MTFDRPSAITSATIPTIRPVDFALSGLRVPAVTLTRLYNERPKWLANAHAALDAAVAAASGWPADLDDDEILRRVFALNQERDPA